MQKIAMAMTIPTVITMTMTMLLPVALFSYVTFETPQNENTSRFLGSPNKHFKNQRKLKKAAIKHGISDTFATKHDQNQEQKTW